MNTQTDERPKEERVCYCCDETIDQLKNYIRTFFRGRFIYLHEECGDFIKFALKHKRPKQNGEPNNEPHS